MKKQIINCRVYDCKFCDKDKDKCRLDSIDICSCSAEEKASATMCDSYQN